MGLTLAQKIIKEHLISGEMTVGNEIAIRIDQTLTQDATGTMAYLEFETMGVQALKMLTTIDSSSQWRKSTDCISADRETESAIRCIWNASASRVRP